MKINVKHVAKLSNLPLSENEEKKFEKQLSEIISYVDKLKKANTINTEITSQVTGLENVIRQDKNASSFSQKEATSNSKSNYNGMFKIKKILR
ncbi:MAG: hypothetical protein A2958_03240 [Candidatus Levybacteria bacterium RIFCSPLOWO2_01_FULL_38_13]|nr:MAG: hypothetical protein A2629_03655 [Candidatus Levybacteria bacterium RIFCSPHIGHO2_01_FULL_41_15]OGH35329.1 MAG: hypothetical protein A2958_03240 [Candidatus Levybacteria bacterium RIFCSPLOWO2_01_FULL_38_13]